jgi:hypothetical protein
MQHKGQSLALKMGLLQGLSWHPAAVQEALSRVSHDQPTERDRQGLRAGSLHGGLGSWS